METDALSEHTATEAIDGGHLIQLVAGDRMSIQHFNIEPGATVPEHSHPHEQVGFVYSGSLTFLIDGEEIVVGTGESFALTSEEPHAAENRGDIPVKGVDIFSPPRANPPWEE